MGLFSYFNYTKKKKKTKRKLKKQGKSLIQKVGQKGSSKYSSLFKQTTPKKAPKKKSQNAFQQIVKFAGNQIDIKQYHNKAAKLNLKRQGKVRNTADIAGISPSKEELNLTSSWISDALFTEEPNGKMYMTIHIAKFGAGGRFRHYEYTYEVKDRKIWEEMKKGTQSKGAGTFFHKYEQYLERIQV